MSRYLFHKAIAMSGNIHLSWVNPPINWTDCMARRLGWDGEGGDEACFEIMKNASLKELIHAQYDTLEQEVN